MIDSDLLGCAGSNKLYYNANHPLANTWLLDAEQRRRLVERAHLKKQCFFRTRLFGCNDTLAATPESIQPSAMSTKRKWDQAAPDSKEESPPKLQKTEENNNTGKSATEAAAAAAAIAAKIAAQFASPSSGGFPGVGDLHDAEFTRDIEINDVRNRYMLTKGSTQQQV